MELARDIASEAVLACHENGYRLSAVVVDRNGIVRAALEKLADRIAFADEAGFRPPVAIPGDPRTSREQRR